MLPFMNDTRLGQIGIVTTVVQHATNPKAYKISKVQQQKTMEALVMWDMRAVAAGYKDAQAWANACVRRPTKAEHDAKVAAMPEPMRSRYLANMEAMRAAGIRGGGQSCASSRSATLPATWSAHGWMPGTRPLSWTCSTRPERRETAC